MIKLGELVMILDLHRQGLSVSAIARQVGVDRKTVRTYIAKGLEPPTYKKRAPALGVVDRFEPYLRERLAAYPALTARRLFREIKERGFSGGYSVVRDRVRDKVERPFRYIREDFFLGGVFRNLEDLNDQLRHWLETVANPRVHATTQRVVNEAFAEEQASLLALPRSPYRSVLRLERRASHEGMVSVGGNLYSVPDTTRRRVFDVHVLADEIRIFEDCALVASHLPLEGRGEKRLDPAHRKSGSFSRRRPSSSEPATLTRAGDHAPRRSLDFYAAVGRRLAALGGLR